MMVYHRAKSGRRPCVRIVMFAGSLVCVLLLVRALMGEPEVVLQKVQIVHVNGQLENDEVGTADERSELTIDSPNGIFQLWEEGKVDPFVEQVSVAEVMRLQSKIPALKAFLPDSLTKRYNSGRHLIVSYYADDYSYERLAEVERVLLSNLRNPEIDKVHVLCQNAIPADMLSEMDESLDKKLLLVPIGVDQPTYGVFFAYANAVLARGTVAIISNSDIAFGPSIQCAQPVGPGNKLVFNQTERRFILALSRHQAACSNGLRQVNECLNYRGSHDSFIFAPPLDPGIPEKLDFVQNLMGAENRVISELRDNMRYRVANPCGVIRSFHHHCSKNSRNVPPKRFAKRGDGQYASVDPLTKFKCGDVIY